MTVRLCIRYTSRTPKLCVYNLVLKLLLIIIPANTVYIILSTIVQLCIHMTLLYPDTGTGKSVTGAHMAYALAMKLRNDLHSSSKQSAKKADASLSPCVMYVGPSQHSVNVVLGEFS